MLSLLIFLAFSWAQIIEPVTSSHQYSNQIFSSRNENAFLTRAYPEADELNLFQRGLENQKGNAADLQQIPTVDAKKAIGSMGRIKSAMLKPIGATLTKLINNFGESTVSELFDHIRNLIQTPNVLRQYPRRSLPSAYCFKNDFSKEALLVAVGELSNESIAKSKPLMQTLKSYFKNTDMEALITNIEKLLEYQPTLRENAELAENVDKAFELDESFDLASLGLPIPTKENPIVYFELIDDKNPTIKFFVKVQLEKNKIIENIIITTDDEDGPWTLYTITESNDEHNLENFYKKLPISKIVEH